MTVPARSPPSDQSVIDAIASLHAAMAMVAMGDATAIKALYSHTADATSFYGWGGYEHGWDAVSKRWDWAGSQFEGGSVSYQNVSTVVTPDMFFVTDIETYTNQRVSGLDGVTGWSNRVTHVFRRENGEWRLVHRHANRHEAQFEPSTRLEPKRS
jgi:ketosteroid isomerase-like protein